MLYLSAIILLLGTTPSERSHREEELEDLIRNLLVSDFRVRAEKAAMIYPIMGAGGEVDTVGTPLRRDSMNVITAHGAFANVRFQFVSIEDSTTGQAVPLERASLVRRSDRSVIFHWRPLPSDRSGVYRVTVAGIATPLPPENLRPELRSQVAEILERRGTVSDSVTFTVNVVAVDDRIALERVRIGSATAASDTGRPAAAAPPLSAAALPFGAAYELTPSQATIPVPAGLSWRNQISIMGGASASELDLKVTEGNATILERTAGFIVLSGNAPASGSQQITLMATRRSDGRQALTSFTVRSVQLAPPPVPQTMLIGQQYPINFAIAGVPSERVAVEVIESDRTGDRVKVARNEGRSVIDYVPSADIARVRFVRYLDGQPVETSIADVKALPVPSFATLPTTPRDAPDVRITTYSYGAFNGQANRVTLKIKSGNAEEPEQVDFDVDERTKRVRQVWLVRRKDRRDEFRFRMYAIDLRGSGSGKSNEVTFVAAQ